MYIMILWLWRKAFVGLTKELSSKEWTDFGLDDQMTHRELPGDWGAKLTAFQQSKPQWAGISSEEVTMATLSAEFTIPSCYTAILAIPRLLIIKPGRLRGIQAFGRCVSRSSWRRIACIGQA